MNANAVLPAVRRWLARITIADDFERIESNDQSARVDRRAEYRATTRDDHVRWGGDRLCPKLTSDCLHDIDEDSREVLEHAGHLETLVETVDDRVAIRRSRGIPRLRDPCCDAVDSLHDRGVFRLNSLASASNRIRHGSECDRDVLMCLDSDRLHKSIL